jgi:hypothetical protein
MKTHRPARVRHDSDQAATAKGQASSWDRAGREIAQPQAIAYDLSQVDLFSHTPQGRSTPNILQRYSGTSSTFNQHGLLNAEQMSVVPGLAAEPVANSTPETLIQRAWDTTLLNYQTMNGEKTGKFRTGKATGFILGKSLRDLVTDFRTALTNRNAVNAKKALVGLKTRLTTDSQKTLKEPKDRDKPQNFVWNAVQAQLEANTFYTKWIAATDAHIEHTEIEEYWLADFRRAYLNVDDLAPPANAQQEFLQNVALLEDITQQERQAMPHLWNLGDNAFRARLTTIMGGSPKLKRMNQVEYFLEAISPIHVGYEKGRNIFNFWAQGVLDHGWTHSYATWMVNQVDGIMHAGDKRIIEYYTPHTRAPFQLTMANKQVVKADGHPLVGDNIYVLSAGGIFYGGAKDKTDAGTNVHHSSFMAGEPVICAGHLHTDNGGNLQSIDNTSGHYAPNKANLKRAVVVLRTMMDVSDVRVYGYGAPQNGRTIDQFLKS